MHVPYVDLGGQYLEHREEILNSIDELLKSGQYILGEELTKFENTFAELCGVKHAIGVADGTAAITLSLRALGVGPGDEVITAPNSFFASASAIIHSGATVKFCDVAADQNMDPLKLEEMITPNTKAILPVHLTGRCADMNPIMEIASKYGLFVVEDSAQAVGASYQGKKAGSIGNTGCFSLHPLKNLNGAGDGGMIATNDDSLAEKLRLMRNHGMVDRDTIPFIGYNSRLDCIQAAILNVKVQHLDEVTKKRRANAELYRSTLGNIVECPIDAEGSFDVYHLFVIQCDRRDELRNFLSENDIQTSVHYPTPIHLFDCFKNLGWKEGDFPEVERQSRRILSLPVHQQLSEKQITFVASKIKEFYS